jgi:DNA-binding transcriptional LysR family regulator
MQGLQQFVAFAETAKHGSFAAGARELGLAPSTLAKAVARLERKLGVRLFHRTTRLVTLTPDGERLFERCQRVLAEVEDLRAEATGTRAAPAGVLPADMPVFYGRKFVLPVLAQLLRQYPALRLDARLSDQQVKCLRFPILSVPPGAPRSQPKRRQQRGARGRSGTGPRRSRSRLPPA